MSLKHAILGFLSYQSFSGYNLKKAFDQSVRHFWPANQSQIYRTLAELKDQGLVEFEVIEREDRLDKKIYHITRTGRREFHDWLASPLPIQDTREPFLIQIYFSGKLSDEEVEHLLRTEIKNTEERLVVYAGIFQAYSENLKTREDKRAVFLSLTTLEYGMFANKVLLEWLQSILLRLQSKDYILRDFSKSLR